MNGIARLTSSIRNVCFENTWCRAADKVHIFVSKMPISSPNPMFCHLLESSHRDDSNKWSSIGFGEEITQVDSIEVNFTLLIWSSDGGLLKSSNH